MKQIIVLSGKGGTGKTTVTAALAHLLSAQGRLVLVDADVDAPNLELIARAEVTEGTPFVGGERAEIDAVCCTACGRCAEVCRYEAVLQADGLYRVDALACEGCAACYHQCPAGAIRMVERLSGRWFRSETRFGTLIHARLLPGEENSGKLVSRIRAEALDVAQQQGAGYILVDGSPGIGCPVIAAVTGADLALLVAEPTLSGVHDLQRALAVAAHFRVETALCINKCDINPHMAQQIVAHGRERAIPVLAQIPYDDIVLEAMRQGLAVTELRPSEVGRQCEALWRGLQQCLQAAE